MRKLAPAPTEGSQASCRPIRPLFLQSARDWFEEAVNTDESHVAAWHMLAVCLAEQGEMEDAKDALDRALALNPKYRPALKTAEEFDCF